jgi:hypothetical protein
MDITADGNWGSDWLNVTFVDKDLLGLFTKGFDVILCEWLALQKLVNLRVQILDI